MSAPANKPHKVVVVGLSKTGTSTLRVMLEELGYKVCGPRKDLLRSVRAGDIASVDATLEAYDAFEDWPWPLVYEHALERYGDRVKFILSTRITFERWFQSLVNHGRRSNLFRGMHDAYGVYRPIGHEDAFRRIYDEHNAAVRSFFAGRPGQLVEFCLEQGDGWEKLCGFLGEPVPAVPVPRTNRGEERTAGLSASLNLILNDAVGHAYKRFS